MRRITLLVMVALCFFRAPAGAGTQIAARLVAGNVASGSIDAQLYRDAVIDEAFRPVERRHGDVGYRVHDARVELREHLSSGVGEAGGRNLEGPELCPGYSPGYYAFFFEDPEGNKLEICCREQPIVRE